MFVQALRTSFILNQTLKYSSFRAKALALTLFTLLSPLASESGFFPHNDLKNKPKV
jgi:hypothetical protein